MERLTIKIPAQTQQVLEGASSAESNISKSVSLRATGDLPFGMDIPQLVKDKYTHLPFFKSIVQNPKHYKNFEYTNSLMYMKHEDGQKVLAIPTCMHKGRNVRQLIIAGAHTLLAHLGTRKTLDYLCDHVWWK
ncbi:hypothetical protein FA15DRAFT_600108, partial [Coprinopsis marcescibilis]